MSWRDRELVNLLDQGARGAYGIHLHLLDRYFLQRYGYRAIMVPVIAVQLLQAISV